jgi:hypothetical protein
MVPVRFHIYPLSLNMIDLAQFADRPGAGQVSDVKVFVGEVNPHQQTPKVKEEKCIFINAFLLSNISQ